MSFYALPCLSPVNFLAKEPGESQVGVKRQIICYISFQFVLILLFNLLNIISS